MKSLRIVFMGTSDFAVATLGSLLMNGLNVVGVVTAPDRPAGRGRKLSRSPVMEFAEYSSLQTMQPENLKDPPFIDSLKRLTADLFIVVAFRMLPEAVWKMPPLGTINLHASLLPHYRGAAPINHVLINGETITGVTTFYIDEKIDTGKILLREKVQIFPFENAGDLHDRLMKHGAGLVIRTISGINDNSIVPRTQSEFLDQGELPKEAPKIFTENCIIDWTKDPFKIHNLIRGLAPVPGARTFMNFGNKKLSIKIFESYPEISAHNLNPCEIVSDGRQFIKIACSNGFVNIGNLQVEGKKRMPVNEFLRGFDLKGWTIVT
jgi:methionyl-tRNA formyltransferase